MKAYHFTTDTLRNGKPIPPVGEWLEHVGEIVPCESGLHASEHPFDALTYAPGSMLHLVELEGEIQSHGHPADKHVGRRRKISQTIDASELLCEFARWCALEVIDFWDAPDVVRQYLETGDEELRAAARAAARSAERSAERVAARAAARAAAWAAAWNVAWNVPWDAAWDTARDATQAVAWDAAQAKQRAKLKTMVEKAMQSDGHGPQMARSNRVELDHQVEPGG